MKLRNNLLMGLIALAFTQHSLASFGSNADYRNMKSNKESSQNIPALAEQLINAVKTEKVDEVKRALQSAPQDPLQRRVYFQYKDNATQSALIVAITKKNSPIVELLLQAGALITLNALKAARVFGQQYVIDRHAVDMLDDSSSKDKKDGKSATQSTLVTAQAHDVKQKLEDAPSDTETEIYIGKYPRTDLITHIESGTFNFNERLNVEEQTVLMCAVATNDLELAQLVIQNGYKKLLAQDMSGDNALSIAIRARHIPMVKFLAPLIGLETHNGTGETALHTAVRLTQEDDMVSNEAFCTEQSALVKCLLDLGAQAHTVDPQGFTPLIDSVHINNPAITKLLLVHGADPVYEDLTRNIPTAHDHAIHVQMSDTATRRRILKVAPTKSDAAINADAESIVAMLAKKEQAALKRNGQKVTAIANSDQVFAELMSEEKKKEVKKKKQQRKKEAQKNLAKGEINTHSALADFYELYNPSRERVFKRCRSTFLKRKQALAELATKYARVYCTLEKVGYTGTETKQALKRSYELLKWSKR